MRSYRGDTRRARVSALIATMALLGGVLTNIGFLPSTAGGEIYGAQLRPLHRVQVREVAVFTVPAAFALRGADLFVANWNGSSVTELDASTGALVRVISGARAAPPPAQPTPPPGLPLNRMASFSVSAG